MCQSYPRGFISSCLDCPRHTWTDYGWMTWTMNYDLDEWEYSLTPLFFFLCCSCHRTGTISCLPYHSSSCVWTPTRAPLSLSQQSPLRSQVDLLQMTPQTLLRPLCMSEFLWRWPPAQMVAHWKELVCKLPWEPSSYIWEVCITMDCSGKKQCKIVCTALNSHPCLTV